MKSSRRTKTHKQAEYRLTAMHAIFRMFTDEWQGHVGLKEALEDDDPGLFLVLESEEISICDDNPNKALNVKYTYEGELQERQVSFIKIDSYCFSFQEVFDLRGIENIN